MKLMIVDDHPVVLGGMAAMLENEDDFEVVAAVESAVEALEICARGELPDVIVMDIHMPKMSGLEALGRLRRMNAAASVLLLAGMPLKAELEEARRLGARGYLPKSMPWKDLVVAIRHAAAGDVPFMEEGYEAGTLGPLTPREKEILGYLAIGKTYEETAIITGIGYETVRTHLRSIQRKLDCPNTTSAVNRAYELGILRP